MTVIVNPKMKGGGDVTNRDVTISRNIKRLREDAGMSQAELSRRLSMSQAFINRVENLRAKAPADLLIGVAEVFNCTLDELVGRDRPA